MDANDDINYSNLKSPKNDEKNSPNTLPTTTSTATTTTGGKDTVKTSLYKDFVAFKCCAKEYILTGASLSELCDQCGNCEKVSQTKCVNVVEVCKKTI